MRAFILLAPISIVGFLYVMSEALVDDPTTVQMVPNSEGHCVIRVGAGLEATMTIRCLEVTPTD